MTDTKTTKQTYKVKQLRKGAYLYTIHDVQIYLEYDGEQTNGMVSGGYGVWKAYPVFKSEILWSAPFDADVQLWYDRKKEFVTDLKESSNAIVGEIHACLEEHMKYLDRCAAASGLMPSLKNFGPEPNPKIKAYNDSQN